MRATATTKERALEKLNAQLGVGSDALEVEDVEFEELSPSDFTPEQLDLLRSTQDKED